jgi:hypothetical protein
MWRRRSIDERTDGLGVRESRRLTDDDPSERDISPAVQQSVRSVRSAAGGGRQNRRSQRDAAASGILAVAAAVSICWGGKRPELESE